MIPFVLALGALAGLVVLHMLRPFFVPKVVSAARFFRQEDEEASAERRPTLTIPWRSRPFYVQTAAFACLVAALWPQGCRSEGERLGVWLLLDTSASMSTRQAEGRRFDLARAQMERVLDDLGAVGVPVRFHLSTFDEVVTTQGTCLEAEEVRQALGRITERALGTDLAGLRGVLEAPSGPLRPTESSSCPLTHRLVVSDLPAPDWIGELGPEVVWLDVATPVPNAGFVSLVPVRHLLSGKVKAVEVSARTFGSVPGATLKLEDGGGRSVFEQVIDWGGDGSWSRRFELAPGRYVLTIAPGGAYGYDDRAEIEVPADAGAPPRVGRLEELAAAEPVSEPWLVLGRGYGGPEAPIGLFDQRSPLLGGLNLDVAARAGIAGVSLPDGFEPVLTGLGGDGDVWIALRRKPRAVLVPGLPRGSDDGVGRFSARAAANALRWLAAGRPPPALYTLTSAREPEPGGTRLALHPGEGKTDHEPSSRGAMADLRSVRTASKVTHWRRWLAGAVALFLLEQSLLGWWGGWR